MSSDEATSPEQEEPVVAETDMQDDAQDVEIEQEDVETSNAEEVVVSIGDLQDQLLAAQAKVQDQQDSVLRAQAEVQNMRRRTERDVANAHKFALEKFSSDLLPVVDTLERALQSASDSDDSDDSTREGIELTLKMLTDTLSKHGVERMILLVSRLIQNYTRRCLCNLIRIWSPIL